MKVIAAFAKGSNAEADSLNLIKFAEYLTQDGVSRYALKSKDHVIEPLLIAQQCKELDEGQFQGIVFLSLLLGGRAWCNLPKMLVLHEDKVTSIHFLETMLEKHYFPSTVTWILKYYKRLDMQSWDFACYLQENPIAKH